ncbi:hypothetical protein BDF14DRAFT_527480 [Spinellus fusiger]|nr:hypothetical protein BDF14DRAFT_527480 [Spinellus fusiger]
MSFEKQADLEECQPSFTFTTKESDPWLPTLDQILKRESRPPVCLYNYYIVLRDRLMLETMLDFWLDIQQAEILHRRYIKHLLRLEKKKTYHLSVATGNISLPSSTKANTTLVGHSKPHLVTQMLLTQQRHSVATTSSTTNSAKTKKPPPTHKDMIELVEQIYLRYIVPHAEKEIVQLPNSFRSGISQHFTGNTCTPDDPRIFADAKLHVYQLLKFVFPLFLHYKASMNLTSVQQLGRIVTGLVSLFVGLSLEFSLIFLNVHPWQKRIWFSMFIFCLGFDTYWSWSLLLNDWVIRVGSCVDSLL